jgi:hypothetical protein
VFLRLKDHRTRIVRWIAALSAISLTTLSFVRLVEVDNRAAQASPWWYVGLSGSVLLMVMLGSPWSARIPGHGSRDAEARTPDRSPPAPS